MSKKSIVRYLVVLLFAVFTSAVLVVADLGALAQNANSSTTTDDSMQNTNTNTTPTRRGRRRGRGRRAAAPAADASVPADAGGAADTGMQSPGEQTDLSGTYTGHVTMSGGHDMDMDGTLTITGNQFTFEGGGMSHSGRIYAVTTRGYTGASFYFSDLTDSATNTPVVAMGRVRKSGDHLSITRIPGSRTSITFASGGGGSSSGGGGRRSRRGRRGRRATPPATETPSDNTNTTPPM